jgi:hypothetical protein
LRLCVEIREYASSLSPLSAGVTERASQYETAPLLCALVASVSIDLSAQSSDWSSVQQIKAGTRIRVIGTVLGTILCRDAGGWAPLLGTAYGGLFAGVAAIARRFARCSEPVYENPVP